MTTFSSLCPSSHSLSLCFPLCSLMRSPVLGLGYHPHQDDLKFRSLTTSVRSLSPRKVTFVGSAGWGVYTSFGGPVVPSAARLGRMWALQDGLAAHTPHSSLEILLLDPACLPDSRFPKALCCLPWCSDGKESACNAGNPGSIPGSGRSPGEGNGNLLQYSYLEKPIMDRGAWRATVHGVTKSRTQLSG